MPLGQMMYKPLSIATLIDHAARYHADTGIVSVITEGGLERLTWGEVAANAHRIASALRQRGNAREDIDLEIDATVDVNPVLLRALQMQAASVAFMVTMVVAGGLIALEAAFKFQTPTFVYYVVGMLSWAVASGVLALRNREA